MNLTEAPLTKKELKARAKRLRESMNDKIPDHTRKTFINYFRHALPPGGFCTAVLANDLVGAVQKADFVNKEFLADIVQWLIWHAPSDSWGSYDRVEGWLNRNEHFEAYQKRLTFDILQEES